MSEVVPISSVSAMSVIPIRSTLIAHVPIHASPPVWSQLPMTRPQST